MVAHAEVIPWIIKAIAKIKGQKQQPNDERISHQLFQNHDMSKDDALKHLAKCVTEGHVIVAVAKNGKNSYRTAEKNGTASPVVPLNQLKLKKCIDDIISNSSREEGMTFEEIENMMRCKKSHELNIEKHSQFSMQLKSALNNGINKRKYTKEGKYYQLTKFPKTLKRQGSRRNDDLTPEEREALKKICGFCKGGRDKNKHGESVDLLTCDECGNSGIRLV